MLLLLPMSLRPSYRPLDTRMLAAAAGAAAAAMIMMATVMSMGTSITMMTSKARMMMRREAPLPLPLPLKTQRLPLVRPLLSARQRLCARRWSAYRLGLLHRLLRLLLQLVWPPQLQQGLGLLPGLQGDWIPGLMARRQVWCSRCHKQPQLVFPLPLPPQLQQLAPARAQQHLWQLPPGLYRLIDSICTVAPHMHPPLHLYLHLHLHLLSSAVPVMKVQPLPLQPQPPSAAAAAVVTALQQVLGASLLAVALRAVAFNLRPPRAADTGP